VITKLNLSSKPFRNRNLPYILALLLLAVAAIGLMLSLVRLRENNANAEIIAGQIKQMEEEIARLKGEGEKVQQELTPDQKALLVASHRLVNNRSFGWSRLFADLEDVLPGGVSASRIAVKNVFQDGGRVKAELDFSVLSRDYPAVMDMIQRMNNSGIFQAELRGQDLQKNERITYTEYTLELVYTPAYGYSSAPSTEVAQTGQGGDR
jgi:Tfp pilus assembly protein PilN